MKNLPIYFFDPQFCSYHLPDETAKNLNLLQRASSILLEKFNEIKRMNLTSIARFALGAVITASCYSMAKLMVNKMMDGQEDGKEINWLANHAISMVITSTIFCGTASKRLIQYYAYSTCLFSQDAQYHSNKIMPYIWKAFLELKWENSDLIDLWCSIKNFKNEEDIQEYLGKKIQQGVCFGYVMAILDQLEKGKNSHGDELLKNIDMNTVIKKQLLQHFHCTFNDLLHSQDEILSEDGDYAIVQLNTNEIIPLNGGKEVKRSVIQKASQECFQLMHLIKGNFRINHSKVSIEVSKGANSIKNHFLEQIKRLSFLEIEQLDPNELFKSIYNCFKVEDFMDKEENMADKPVSEQATLPVDDISRISRFIDYFKKQTKARQARKHSSNHIWLDFHKIPL